MNKTIAISGRPIEINLFMEQLRKKYGNITMDKLIDKLEKDNGGNN
ncbi:hypothetical protein KAI04_04185 [Candidatus Pacearchaeota archaeon]|nr:hypothetical protein [Candidatus Pacearchaeota archaeon]